MANNPFRELSNARSFASELSKGGNDVLIIHSQDTETAGTGYYVEREGGVVRAGERVVARYRSGNPVRS